MMKNEEKKKYEKFTSVMSDSLPFSRRQQPSDLLQLIKGKTLQINKAVVDTVW